MQKKLFISLCILLFSAFIMAQNEDQQEVLEQSNLVYLNTAQGLVVLELAPFIAPNHTARFKALVAEGFYDGLDFYRVIDGFVAQAGDVSEEKASEHKTPLKAEFIRPVDDKSDFILVQSPAFLAQQTGFIQGFPAGRNDDDGVEWLLHCPGAVGMARTNDIDTGTTDFYIVIGQAPRALDRNMTVFAQVIYGMEHVQSMQRGDPDIDGGVIDAPEQRSNIIKVELGESRDKASQLSFVRDSVTGEVFQQRLNNARTLSNEFYHYKGTGNVDVCYYKPRATLFVTETSNQ